MRLTRRSLLKSSGAAFGISFIAPKLILAATGPLSSEPQAQRNIRLSFNENSYGPSPRVQEAIQGEFTRLNRYPDDVMVQQFTQQIANYENVPVEQVVLGNILDLLGTYLGNQGGSGGEFIYSTPGYRPLIEASASIGSVGVPVPLNAKYENDLPAILKKVNEKTRAIYLVNPHQPSGTMNDDAEFKHFLQESSRHAVVIVAEVYLEYASDFRSRSAVSLVREGANVIVFRSFDKIYGLAGLSMGYLLAPRGFAKAFRSRSEVDPDLLGRLNLVAASAALKDTAHADKIREAVAHEREIWLSLLHELKLEHAEATANFVFFNTGMKQEKFAAAMLAQGIEVGGGGEDRLPTWSRVTIGLPEENRRAQAALRRVLA
jgi:histidinol-phosphate aminotransferase